MARIKNNEAFKLMFELRDKPYEIVFKAIYLFELFETRKDMSLIQMDDCLDNAYETYMTDDSETGIVNINI